MSNRQQQQMRKLASQERLQKLREKRNFNRMKAVLKSQDQEKKDFEKFLN